MDSLFTIIYFTADPNDGIIQGQMKTKYLTEDAILFDDTNQCVDFITDNPNEKIILIASDHHSLQCIVSALHECPQLICIYLLGEEDQLKNIVEDQKEYRKVCLHNFTIHSYIHFLSHIFR